MKGFPWDDDPMELFQAWLAKARAAGAMHAEAMTLATATPDGRPSARIVLLKAVDRGRFCFYSNGASRKGRELDGNARVAAVFYWPAIGRQVRVEGAVERLPRRMAAAYFHTRPLESRLSSHVSPQSRVIGTGPAWSGRARLVRQARVLGCLLGPRPPCPPHWTGWAIQPESLEFWQNGEGRMHYRLQYRRTRRGWGRAELAP